MEFVVEFVVELLVEFPELVNGGYGKHDEDVEFHLHYPKLHVVLVKY